MSGLRFVCRELAAHRWIVPGLALTGSAALGSALPDLILALFAFGRGMLS